MEHISFDKVAINVDNLYKLVDEQYQAWKDARGTYKTVKAICSFKPHLLGMKLCLDKKEITAFINLFRKVLVDHYIQDCFRSRAKAGNECIQSRELAVIMVLSICADMLAIIDAMEKAGIGKNHNKAKDIFFFIDNKTRCCMSG